MTFRSRLAAGLLALGMLGAASPALAGDVHMFVRHEVADYATWQKAYDGFRATQKKRASSPRPCTSERITRTMSP